MNENAMTTAFGGETLSQPAADSSLLRKGANEGRTLETVAAEIRTFTASMLNNVIEIGRRFVEAKELLPYGEFGAWVKENTAYSVSSANNFMRLFNEYGSAQGCLFGAETESQTFGKLSYSKALALLAVPAEEREEFVETHDVDAMSTRELERAIRERDEAQHNFEASEKLRAEMEDEFAGVRADLAEAERKITELEARPVEVAVEKPDPEEVQKKIDAAVKEVTAKAAADAKILREKMERTEKQVYEKEKQIDELKKAAEEAGKKALAEQAGLVSIEKERLEREIEGLKKQIAMSDAAVAGFKVLFDQTQDILNRLLGAMEKVQDQETAGKLRAAVAKLLQAYGEEVTGDG